MAFSGGQVTPRNPHRQQRAPIHLERQPFNLLAPFHLNEGLVQRGEEGTERECQGEGEEEGTGAEEGLETQPWRARQPSSGWAL